MTIFLLLFLSFSTISASSTYLIPDDTRLVLYKLKRDFKKAQQIDISTNELSSKKIFRMLVKALNRKDVNINIILDPNKYSLISNLSIYKGINIRTLSGIRDSEMNLNFILIDNLVLYIFSNGFSKIALNQSYGVALRIEDIRTIKNFRRIFNILNKRSSIVKNLR